MLGSPLLGTAVGLVLLFATTALLCSGITESISTLFQMRACYLLTGMRAMLDAQDTDPPPAAPGTPSAVQPETSEAAPPSVGKAAPAPPGVSAKGSLHRQWPPPTPVRSAKARPQRSECVTKELTALGAAGLPVGQPAGCEAYAPLAAACFLAAPRPVPLLDEMLKLVGWAITAFAVSFGAPFWFEALSRLGSLRSAGTPPAQTPAQA